MKNKCYLLLIIIGLLFILCGKIYPTTIEYPNAGYRNNQILEVEKVILTDSTTLLYLEVYLPPGHPLQIDEAYIQIDEAKYFVQSAEGLKLNEKSKTPESGIHKFVFTFAALPQEKESIDFIASNNDLSLEIYDIDLTGKAKSYESTIPTEITNIKTDKNITYPAQKFEYGKTKLTIHIEGLREGVTLDQFILHLNNILLGRQEELNGRKEGESTYIYDFDLYMTSVMSLNINNRSYVFYVNPGENAEIYIDLIAISKEMSRYNSQKNMHKIGFKGEFADINTQISQIDIFKYRNHFAIKPNTSFINMQKNVFFDHLLTSYNEKIKLLDAEDLTTVQRQYLKNIMSTNLFGNCLSIEALYTKDFREQNKGDTTAIENYKAPKFEEKDLYKLRDIFKDNLSIYYLESFYTFSSYLIKASRDNFTEIWGDVGFIPDIKVVRPLLSKISGLNELTAEEKAKLASRSSYYAEIADLMYNNAKKLHEEAIEKGDLTIEETPQVSDDKILDAIVSKYKGKAVFIDFWATWCGPCKSAMKKIKEIKSLMADKNVVSVYITDTTSQEGQWNEMLLQIGGTHYRLDKKQFEALKAKYNFKGIPTYIIFDKSGNKLFQSTGYPGNDKVVEELSKIW